MVYGQLPKYLINRLQRVQNTTAGHDEMLDVINLNWLPIEDNIEMNTVKLAHKSLNDELWPNYLALIERKRNLRSSDLEPIVKQGVLRVLSRQSLEFVLSLEFDFCFRVQMQLLCVAATCCFPVSISILFSNLVSDHSFHSILFSTGQFRCIV